jgi:hypothetical protein
VGEKWLCGFLRCVFILRQKLNWGMLFSCPSCLEFLMEKLICQHCGTKFNCGAPSGKDHCWCMGLPNLRGTFDLAGTCVCPDCLTMGKAKAMIKSRKVKQRQRAASALRK